MSPYPTGTEVEPDLPFIGQFFDRGGAVRNVMAYGVTGGGSVDESSALSSIPGSMLYFPPGTYKISANVTFASSVSLIFAKGAALSVDNGVTVTINGLAIVFDPIATTFGGAGTVTSINYIELDPFFVSLSFLRTPLAFASIVDGDTTPDVSTAEKFATANTGATTITDLDGGVDGMERDIVFGDSNTTIDFASGGPLKGNAGIDWSPQVGDSMRCVFDGSNWHCDPQENV